MVNSVGKYIVWLALDNPVIWFTMYIIMEENNV